MDVKTVVRALWDRIAAWVLVGAGGLLLLLGWLGVSRAPYAEEQIPYVISDGFSGLALIGIGATLWLSSDLRDEWHRLRGLEEAVRDLVAAGDPPDPTTELPTAAESNGTSAPRRRSATK
jgi:hypothetical protein